VLVLSGDGDLGKTALAMALILYLCPSGFWFLDDPDDFREIDGDVVEGHGIVVDEIELSSFHPNLIKKLFDVKLSRRIRCRHLNAFLPKQTPRIYITNSCQEDFYPAMKKQDATGVKRRQFFVDVTHDVRVLETPAPNPQARVLPVSTKPAGLQKGPSGSASVADAARHSLAEAHLCHYEKTALAWCTKMGVALMSEVADNCCELAASLGLKPLEVRRLEKVLSQYTVSESVAKPASQGQDAEEEKQEQDAEAEMQEHEQEDVFAFGCHQ
jgi:hypothetical protein